MILKPPVEQDEKPQAQAFCELAAIAARIASVDIFVRGFTIPNRSMSALTLNHGNGECIVYEYYVFANFYPRVLTPTEN